MKDSSEKMSDYFDSISLRKWFESEKRPLPWREHRSPYAVWVSEIMLQQTQVSVVIPYFERWMQLFPTIEALAAAPIETVIKAWEGLGYYSRARNLHAGAKYVMEQHKGILPCDAKSLSQIKGLGPYTVGAIRSFAFHQKAAAVDGNVQRVLARYFHVTADLSQSKTVNSIWEIAENSLPTDNPWVITEALIELGATVCSKTPKCHACPLRKSCLSYRHGSTDKIPFKSKKQKIERIYRAVAVISTDCGHLLTGKVQPGQIMSGLYEFPYFDVDAKGISADSLIELIKTKLGIEVSYQNNLESVKHSFTRFNATLFPMRFKAAKLEPASPFEWITFERIKHCSFSSGHKRILTQILDMKNTKRCR